MTFPKDFERYTISKDFFVVVPIIASATGVTFDVGYFYGININYFTLFPLASIWSLR
jgi:hypothetical protein